MTLTFLGGKSGFPLCLLNHQVIQAGFQEGLWNSDVIEALKAWRMCRIWEGNFWWPESGSNNGAAFFFFPLDLCKATYS